MKLVFVDDVNVGMTGALKIPAIVAKHTSLDHVPLTLLWPGFLVDTAFWGGAAFLLWSVPGFVRRRSRRRRGRCVACGYDLKGSGGEVCPECGGAER